MEKIKLKIHRDDLPVVSNATNRYARTLSMLMDRDNTSQQQIHASILNEFRFELMKKLTKREAPDSSTFKMEVHTAFVLYDSLQHYSQNATNALEGAILRRIIMELFSLLPFTNDHNELSVMSNLNFDKA